MKKHISSPLCVLALIMPLALRAVGLPDPPSSVPGIINYQGRVAVQGVNFTGTGQFKFALVDGGVNLNRTATAFATVMPPGSQIIGIGVADGGAGYTFPPEVTITNASGGSGSGATATAIVAPDGSVSGFSVTSGGSGYSSMPGAVVVTIAPPPPNIVHLIYWSNDGTSVQGSEPTNAVALGVNAGLYAVPLGDTALANMQTIPASVFQNPDVRLRVWFDDGTHGSQLLSPDQRLVSAPYAMHAAKADSVDAAAITTVQIADDAVTAEKLAPASVTVQSLLLSNGAAAAAAAAAAFAPGAGGPGAGQLFAADGNGGFMVVDGLSLPLKRTVGSMEAVFDLTNDGDGAAIRGEGLFGDGVVAVTAVPGKSGLYGVNNATFVLGNQPKGQGVYGEGTGIAVGVLGVSAQNDGISGLTNANGKSGVFGFTTKAANGVAGISEGGAGVFGRTYAANQNAVYGYTESSNSAGVKGYSFQGDGVVGNTSAGFKSGVFGYADRPDNNGVSAINANGTGLYAKTESATANAGFFWNTAGGNAILADGKITAYKDIISTGAGNEQAYMGGDGNGDVEFGSKNANVTLAAFWNPASNKLLDIKAHDATVRSLTITGGADLAEPFAMRDAAELAKGTVVVIDDKAPGQLKQSTREYDTCVAGIVSGANGINPGIALKQEGVNETGQQVALTGRVYCMADASFGAIKPGDLLTTSSTPGHAMRVNDHERAQGAVLGKAMSSLDEGTGFVLVLVTLQ